MENQELVKIEPQAVMNIAEVKENVQLIQQVLRTVMKKGVHYDVLPGCGNKDVLLKPGAEKILVTFKIGTDIKIEDLSSGIDFRYRIIIRGFHIPTDQTVGYGVGECSTSEKKYAWREALCDEEFEQYPETQRQIYWKKDYRSKQVVSVKQVRQTPIDLANTVLKMAKKRAMIDLCLTATACSDVFAQDIDEEHIAEAVGVPQAPAQHFQQPQATTSDASTTTATTRVIGNEISDAQCKRLYAIGKNSSKSGDEIKKHLSLVYNVSSSKQIQKQDYETICNWVEGK